jgi:hypothetical protein
LFLGDDAARAISATSGVFPVSQDQRNTLRARFRYDIFSDYRPFPLVSLNASLGVILKKT